MLTSGKRTSSSFGPDGRRISGNNKKHLKCIPRTSSGFSRPNSTSCTNYAKSSNKLFQPGAKLIVSRAPVMSGLSLGGVIQKKFQRPMTKRRSYDKRAEEALARCSLGQKRRMDGMAKLMARAGKGLSYRSVNVRPEEDGEDESGSESEEEKEPERPFEPLLVWKSPHEGGDPRGLPPKLYVAEFRFVL